MIYVISAAARQKTARALRRKDTGRNISGAANAHTGGLFPQSASGTGLQNDI
ncbi:MAG: hypothetical protein OEN55_05675 [Alphaproteobacteria bacterium]|nr:hypothetical protein [Alphaproteobacteria bacterium]